MEELGGQTDAVFQVHDQAPVARERVETVGAQTVRPVGFELDFFVEAISPREKDSPGERLGRALVRAPDAENLSFGERVLERASTGAGRRGEGAHQEPSREDEPVRPLQRRPDRLLRAPDLRGIAELEGERVPQVEVLVAQKEGHVVLNRKNRPRELEPREEETEAALVRKDEAVGFAKDRSESHLLAAVAGEEPHHGTVAFVREPLPARQLVGSRAHREARDLASFRVEPGLLSPLIVKERPSRRGIEGTESAREIEEAPIAVAVMVVKEVE